MKKAKRSGKFYVYILECVDGTYYTGYTNDLEKRLKEHNHSKRGAKYTRHKRPVEVVWLKGYQYKYYAMSAEYKIKQLSRFRKKMLVDGTVAKRNKSVIASDQRERGNLFLRRQEKIACLTGRQASSLRFSQRHTNGILQQSLDGMRLDKVLERKS